MAERGSTLMEVLVALAVLGIGVAAAVQLLLLGLSTESQAALREAATLRLADADEMLAAWSGSPPPARVSEWRADAGALRPDAPGNVVAVIDALSAPGTLPVQLRATLGWGDSGHDSASLLAALYVRAAPPP